LNRADWADFDFVIITAPEDALKSICARIRNVVCDADGVQGPLVVHTSGVASHELLGLYGLDVAKCGAIHPLFPFRSANESPTGEAVIHGISGPSLVVEKSAALIRSLDGRSFPLKSEQRALYHLACVLASNHVVTLAALAQMLGDEVSEEPGVLKVALTNLMRASVENLQMVSDPSEALSGPVSRGDVETLAKHFDALEDRPELAELYRHLIKHTVPLAPTEHKEALGRFMTSKTSTKSE